MNEVVVFDRFPKGIIQYYNQTAANDKVLCVLYVACRGMIMLMASGENLRSVFQYQDWVMTASRWSHNSELFIDKWVQGENMMQIIVWKIHINQKIINIDGQNAHKTDMVGLICDDYTTATH